MYVVVHSSRLLRRLALSLPRRGERRAGAQRRLTRRESAPHAQHNTPKFAYRPEMLCMGALRTAQSPPAVHTGPILLALGVVADPRLPERRRWLRQRARHAGLVPSGSNNAKTLEQSPHTVRNRQGSWLAMRFVIGDFDPRANDRMVCSLADEASAYADLLFTRAAELNDRACVEKSFLWYVRALRLFPFAQFVGKTDDDSFHHLGNLRGALQMMTARVINAASGSTLLYAGWPQYSSYLPEFNRGCGWSTNTRGALFSARPNGTSNCARCTNHPFCYVRGISTEAPLNSPIVGPFPFATGALQLMSGPLARRVFTSNWTVQYIQEQRRFRRTRQHKHYMQWTCAAEDGLIGLAVAQSVGSHVSPARVAFVTLGGLIVDAADAQRSGAQRRRRAHADVRKQVRAHRQPQPQPQAEDETGIVAELSKYITVHKLEIDEARLQSWIDTEVHRNHRLNISLSIWRERAELNRWLRPKLEAIDQTKPMPMAPVTCITPEHVAETRQQGAKRLNPALDNFFNLPATTNWSFCEAVA